MNDTQPENCHAMVYVPTLRERIANALFPPSHIDAPEIANQHDVIHTHTEARLSWDDRLRILISGRCRVTTKTATEHQIGNHATAGHFVVLPPLFLDAHARP